MKKTDAVAIYRVLSPLAITKFSNDNQQAILGNYLKLHDVAKAHDDAIRVASEKLRAEELSDEDKNVKMAEAINNLFNEEVTIELAQVDRAQFLAEASKAGIEVSLAQVATLAPMFK